MTRAVFQNRDGKNNGSQGTGPEKQNGQTRFFRKKGEKLRKKRSGGGNHASHVTPQVKGPCVGEKKLRDERRTWVEEGDRMAQE